MNKELTFNFKKIVQTSVLLLLVIIIFCCNYFVEIKKNNAVIKNIRGDWGIIIIPKQRKIINGHVAPAPLYKIPQGMKFSNDSIESYLGFFKDSLDNKGRFKKQYLGNSTSFKINNDSICIKNLSNGKWEFKWKFVSRKNDTLKLAINNTTFVLFKKLNYNPDNSNNFDQIIFSSSGCYGSCPIIDISITKEGNILFQGEGYTTPLGFYSGKINHKTKNYIFNKFKYANPLKLKDSYSVNHTDDQSLTTTFVKNGKIIKTISDYGMAGTKELIWAYIAISNFHKKIHLKSLPLDEPFYPKLNYFSFKKGDLNLYLEKSESFYLWTELKKSKQTNGNFKSKYKVIFNGNYTYWGPDPNEARQHKYEISSITTDGQFFKFEFKGKEPETYNLGYNFIERNFKEINFK